MAVIKGGNGRPTSFIDTWQPAASLHKPAVILQGMSPGLMVLYIITTYMRLVDVIKQIMTQTLVTLNIIY